MMATGTYWLGAPAMAAALATLHAVERDNVMFKVNVLGKMLANGLAEAAQQHGLWVTISGPPSMPFLTFDEDRPFKRPLGERWCQEMAGHGVWLHPHHNW